MSAVYFMRSAMAPTMSAGVMMAKVSWNMANTESGTPASLLEKAMSFPSGPYNPLKKTAPRSPMNLPSPEKLRL